MNAARILGAFALGVAAFWIGQERAARFSRRSRTLHELISGLRRLSTEMLYRAMPLPEALLGVSEGRTGPASTFFRTLGSGIADGQRLTEVFAAALGALDDVTADDERAALAALGEALGMSDRADQEHHLRLCLDRLERAEGLAREEEARGVRLWRSLGAACAAAVVLLLI